MARLEITTKMCIEVELLQFCAIYLVNLYFFRQLHHRGMRIVCDSGKMPLSTTDHPI